MKFSTIYKNLLKEEEEEQAPPVQQVQPPQPKQVQEPTEPANEDPLISNIDQHWMNPESLKSDLYRWLTKMQSKDPEMARMTMNSIRNVLGKFRYKPEASKEQQIEQ